MTTAGSVTVWMSDPHGRVKERKDRKWLHLSTA
jgi:hypothetical protein